MATSMLRQLLEVRDCHSKPGEDSHDDYDNYLDMLAAVWFSLAERPRQRGFNGNQYVYHTSRAFALDLDSCHLFMLPNNTMGYCFVGRKFRDHIHRLVCPVKVIGPFGRADAGSTRTVDTNSATARSSAVESDEYWFGEQPCLVIDAP
ncbi:hypothetical protein DPMN_042742 [Dreissena polymorpha]|uniref:Uncharacterized protein n=1 Tax=Dreissena polymorpha TaxID=45954 RepID=A0A9D4HX64_DREPO|nr:hypothetical protein DPMN_042742 [Dreissena polymorpha]